MEKEVVSMPVGPETELELKLIDGKIVLGIEYNGADGFGSIEVGIKPAVFLDKLANMIPGQMDDVVINALKVALGA